MIYDENYNYEDNSHDNDTNYEYDNNDDDSSTIVCQQMIRYIDDTFDKFESSIFH